MSLFLLAMPYVVLGGAGLLAGLWLLFFLLYKPDIDLL